jgi:hypothetical protein
VSRHSPYLKDLAAGQRVHHWKFGPGEVLTTSRVDGTERARADFGPRGVRNLSVGPARLMDPADTRAGLLQAPWQDMVDNSAPLAPLGREPWSAWFGPASVQDDEAFLGALLEIDRDVGQYPVARFGAVDVGWPELTVFIHPASAAIGGMVQAGVLMLWSPADDWPFFAFPFYTDSQHVHEVTPYQILVCTRKVEAVVKAVAPADFSRSA